MSKVCPKCSTVNPDSAKFCCNCAIQFRKAITYYDGFISYRRDGGSETARLIKMSLETMGNKNVFLDVDELSTGHFDESLLTMIEGAANFILILTPGSLDRCSNEGDWVRREIAHAIKHQRTIIPVMKAGFRFPPADSLPEELRQLPRYNGVAYDHRYMEAAIRKILEFMAPRLRGEIPPSSTEIAVVAPSPSAAKPSTLAATPSTSLESEPVPDAQLEASSGKRHSGGKNLATKVKTSAKSAKRTAPAGDASEKSEGFSMLIEEGECLEISAAGVHYRDKVVAASDIVGVRTLQKKQGEFTQFVVAVTNAQDEPGRLWKSIHLCCNNPSSLARKKAQANSCGALFAKFETPKAGPKAEVPLMSLSADQQNLGFKQILAAVDRFVAPLLIANLVRRLRDGHVIKIGPCECTRRGVTFQTGRIFKRTHEVEWSELEARLIDGQLYLNKWAENEGLGIALTEENAAYLPALREAMAKRAER